MNKQKTKITAKKRNKTLKHQNLVGGYGIKTKSNKKRTNARRTRRSQDNRILQEGDNQEEYSIPPSYPPVPPYSQPEIPSVPAYVPPPAFEPIPAFQPAPAFEPIPPYVQPTEIPSVPAYVPPPAFEPIPEYKPAPPYDSPPVTPPDEPVTPPEEPVTPPDEPVTPPEEPVTPPEEPVTPPEEPVTPPEEPVTPPEEPEINPEYQVEGLKNGFTETIIPNNQPPTNNTINVDLCATIVEVGKNINHKYMFPSQFPVITNFYKQIPENMIKNNKSI
jgi:hypothetical protein